MYQKCIFVGRLGRDPEMRYTRNGSAVTNFSIAVQQQKDDDVLWVRVSCWERLAETCNQYLEKGKLVLVEGRVRISEWTDKDGNTKTSMEMTATSVQFLSPREE